MSTAGRSRCQRTSSDASGSAGPAAQGSAAAESGASAGHQWDRPIRRHARVESRQHRSDGHSRIDLNSERRATPARRSSAFYSPKPLLRSVHHCDAPTKNPSRSWGLAADHNGATSLASALGIRSGATPCGHIHPNIHFLSPLPNPDISIWQRTGHFYLALTVALVHTRAHEMARSMDADIFACFTISLHNFTLVMVQKW